MTNRELQEKLREFPEDSEIVMNVNGALYCEPQIPRTRFMGTAQKYMIVLDPKYPKV